MEADDLLLLVEDLSVGFALMLGQPDAAGSVVGQSLTTWLNSVVSEHHADVGLQLVSEDHGNLFFAERLCDFSHTLG